jgi:hypothetical protein
LTTNSKFATILIINKDLNMSKMSELAFEINDMLEAGYLPVTIARDLEIPVSWVYETAEDNEEHSPFQTVNS